MQQVRAATAVRRAQVEIDPARLDRGCETCPSLRPRDVADERDLWRLSGHRPDGGAPCQLVDDGRQLAGRTADHCDGGVEHLVEARSRALAQGGHGLGEASRADEVIR